MTAFDPASGAAAPTRTPPPTPAVVLLSGGLDSATCLAIAQTEHDPCHAIAFRYGQRHEVELEAAQALADRAGVELAIVDIDLRAFGGSALTADIDVPKHSSVDELDPAGDGIPITYVPARNTIFLSFALAFAEVRGARDLYIGVNALDYSGYPDCRPEFIEAYETMANLATRAAVEDDADAAGDAATGRMRIHTPLIDLTKGEIIARGMALGVDYAMTTSCYDPVRVDGGDGRGWVACGHCDSCLLRQKGFTEAGLVDPIPYAP